MSKIVINQDATFVSDAGEIITTLNGLNDVTITSVTNNQVLKYNSSINRWVNGTDDVVTAIGQLSDVTISTLANGQLLIYNSSSGNWENSDTIDGGTY